MYNQSLTTKYFSINSHYLTWAVISHFNSVIKLATLVTTVTCWGTTLENSVCRQRLGKTTLLFYQRAGVVTSPGITRVFEKQDYADYQLVSRKHISVWW